MALSIKDPEADRLAEQLLRIARRCASLPIQDSRTAEEILGYDRHGLPR